MKCQTCGNHNADDSRFCGSCGSDLVTIGEIGSFRELPMVEFGESISRAFQNYFTFSGRATRAEYWWFLLFTQILGLIGLVPIVGWVISILGTIAIIIPGISVTSRRLHDIGKSAWWMVVWLFVGVAWVFWSIGVISDLAVLEESLNQEEAWGNIVRTWLVPAGFLMLASIGMSIWWLVWFVRKGDEGSNKYGPDPRQPALQHPPEENPRRYQPQ